MAYLSDIDLATLHKKRLDEKNHYKLSWYNRRFYDDEMSREQHISMKHDEHKVKSKVASSVRSTKAKANESQTNAVTTCVASARATNDENTVAHVAAASKSSDRLTNGNRNRSPDFYDEGYYSSPTMNRRRSGTWP